MPTVKSWLRALGVLVLPAHASAQLRAELTPFVGSYYAMGSLGTLVAGVEEEKQENQPVFGGTLVVRLTQTLGVEGAFALTPSGVNVTGTANQGFSGTIMFASARARVSVPRTNLYGLGGLGLVVRGGQAWEGTQFTSLSSIAGIVGFGTQAEVSRSARIDVKAELNLYSADPDGDGASYESKVQADLLVGLGVPISLSRRR